MLKQSSDKKKQILDAVNGYFSEHGFCPTVRDIAETTGIPRSTVHRYLIYMNESGELTYDNRTITTPQMDRISTARSMRVLGSVSCGPGEEEREEVLEYISMPENLIGKGNFFALIAKGESMIDAGIHPGDYVIIRQTNTAEPGQIVVALSDGVSNLKKLCYDAKRKQYFLGSCNEDKTRFADIYVNDLQVQGVAVGVYHSFE